MSHHSLLAASLAALIVAASPLGAFAALFAVNTTTDAADATIDGTCASAAGACTLRAAIQEANATPGVADTITLPAGKYVLKLVGAFEELCATGDLDIRADLTINGAGSTATLIIGKKDRVLDIFDDADVTLSGLTITKGALGKGRQTGSELQGAGIFNDGDLTLSDVVVSNNKTTDDGGGIHNIDTIIGTDVTIIKNKASLDGAGINHVGNDLQLTRATIAKNKAGDEGGAIQNISSLMTLVNVTISGNTAGGPGGGINTEGTSPISDIRSATFSGNKSKEAGGAIAAQTALPFVTNSIFEKSKPTNCNTPVGSGGGNFETQTGCGFPAQNSGIKKLGLKGLKLNGGLTATHALKEGSPVIDGAVDAQCTPLDQRSVGRSDFPGVGTTTCDAGAFELVLEP